MAVAAQETTAAVMACRPTSVSGIPVRSAMAVSTALLTWSVMAYQVVWVTTVTYLVWFWLVSRYPPARLSVLSFLAPVFGVISGHVVLGEPLTGSLAVALVLVTIGIVLVNRPAPAPR